MERASITEQLKSYIAQQILYGEDVGLDENTPLLEWGIINSLEIVQLISFIQHTFHVNIPVNKITPENFTTLSAITDAVMETL